MLLRIVAKQERYLWQVSLGMWEWVLGTGFGPRLLPGLVTANSSVLTRLWVFVFRRCWKSSSVGNGQTCWGRNR